MSRISSMLKFCPYCGKEKKFACSCEYGKLMKMKMEPNDKQKGFFHKRYCPKCGNPSTGLTCGHCQFSFSEEDFWSTNYF